MLSQPISVARLSVQSSTRAMSGQPYPRKRAISSRSCSQWSRRPLFTIGPIVNNGRRLHWEHEREEIARFLGYGWPDIARVLDCTESRATLIGWDSIHAQEADIYRVPLPAGLQGTMGFRAVSVTLAWLTPV